MPHKVLLQLLLGTSIKICREMRRIRTICTGLRAEGRTLRRNWERQVQLAGTPTSRCKNTQPCRTTIKWQPVYSFHQKGHHTMEYLCVRGKYFPSIGFPQTTRFCEANCLGKESYVQIFFPINAVSFSLH